jgi:mannose-6-phosphate isomerase-like protein (cupin superfamily)
MEKISPKIVRKPWGQEEWIADGVRTPYALKRIFFQSGQRSSLHVHQFKHETNYVISGSGLLELSVEKLDFEIFLNSENSLDHANEVARNLAEIPLSKGDIIDVSPGFLHRVISTNNLTFIECSTCELDDVYRIADDNKRGHGRIASEHIP